MKAGKWKLSPYWWANFWFLFGLTVVAEVTLLLLTEEFLLTPMVLLVLMFLLGALHPWRFLMTMEVWEGVCRSYLFGRLCCEVFMDRPVYYALLEFDEHNSISQPYIAISNHPFRVRPRSDAMIPLRSDRFIDYYDRKKIIIFSRNEETEACFPLERWYRVN